MKNTLTDEQLCPLTCFLVFACSDKQVRRTRACRACHGMPCCRDTKVVGTPISSRKKRKRKEKEEEEEEEKEKRKKKEKEKQGKKNKKE